MVRITRSLPKCFTRKAWKSMNNQDDDLSTYIFFESIQDESFQLSQAFVDPGSSPLFHNRLGGLKIKNTRC